MSLRDLDKKLYQKDFKPEDDYSFKKEQINNQANENILASKCWGVFVNNCAEKISAASRE